METLYRICPHCKGTGDQDTPDGPPCSDCQGVGFTPAYVPFSSAMNPSSGAPVNRAAPPSNAANPQHQYPPQQSYPTQQSSYQQQAQNYVPGTNNPGPSPRQMKFIEDLWTRIGWTSTQGEEQVKTQFGVTVPNLTRNQASTVIEDLKAREAAIKSATAGTPVYAGTPAATGNEDVPF